MSHKRCRPVVSFGPIFCLPIVLAFASIVFSGGDDSSGFVKNVRKAWSDRRARFSAVEYVYTTKRRDRTEIDPESPLKESESPKYKYLEYTNTSRILVSGSRIRFEVKGQRPSEAGIFYEHDSIAVFDGIVSKTLDNSKNRSYQAGFIHKDPMNRCVLLAETLPVRWTFAPYRPKVYGIDLDKALFTAKGKIDGHDCCILRTGDPKHVQSYYWLDPSRDYSILRYSIETDGKVEFQLECSYKLDSRGLWYPFQWTGTSFSYGGEVTDLETTVLDKFNFDAIVSDTDFDLIFPSGSIVSDIRPQTGIGRTGTLDYLVKSNGEKRIITWNERNATYEQILKTPSGEAGQEGTSNKQLLPFFPLAVPILLVILVILCVVRWKRYRATRLTP